MCLQITLQELASQKQFLFLMALHMMVLYTPLTFSLVMFLFMLLCFVYPICKSPRSSLALSLQAPAKISRAARHMHTRAQSKTKRSTSKSTSKMQNDLDRGWLMLFRPALYSMCSYSPYRVHSLGNVAK